jgi:2'-5' RNA ligase
VADPPAPASPPAPPPAAPPAVRAFVALALDPHTRAAVEAATGALRADPAADPAGALRWGTPDTWHLTLRFLGDVPPDTVTALGGSLAGAASRCRPVDLRFTGAGAFPPAGRPRVVWIGVAATPALVAAHRAVEDACAAVGLGRERRPFRPHLTVARVRPGRVLDLGGLGAALARVGFVAATRVASLHLMRSDLSPAGARHSTLAHAPFGAAAPEPPAGA